MRPSRSTETTSQNTSPKPPTAKRPSCTMCQSSAMPSVAEYWHSGGTAARLGMVRPRSVSGENSSDPMRDVLRNAVCCAKDGTADARRPERVRVRHAISETQTAPRPMPYPARCRRRSSRGSSPSTGPPSTDTAQAPPATSTMAGPVGTSAWKDSRMPVMEQATAIPTAT